MLFNSYQFIFLFLIPLLAIIYYLPIRYVIPTLILSSVLFYAQWDILHLLLLLISIISNYSLAKYMTFKNKKLLLAIGILLNLSILIYFKYALFLSLSSSSLLLPLAISFYTFQQIAFLVDFYKNKITNITLQNYLFFILFFPQLVAGPIVHYNELIPQILKKTPSINQPLFWLGVMLFSFGLFKKVVLADSLSPIADSAFSSYLFATSLDAWLGLFAYSFQIYFDFSGYADMAIGLSAMLGVKLPINFNSPYLATTIIEFWRRWHITLSNFLKEHIYIPLGGSRTTKAKITLNLLITMTIGGIWHGSGYTFILWGASHGLLLAIAHALNIKNSPNFLNNFLKIALTFTLVTLLWVLFRAPTLEIATTYYKLLFSFGIQDINTLQTTLHQGFFHNLISEPKLSLLLFSALIIFAIKKNSSYYYTNTITPKHIFTLSIILGFIALKTLASTPSNIFVYFNF